MKDPWALQQKEQVCLGSSLTTMFIGLFTNYRVYICISTGK